MGDQMLLNNEIEMVCMSQPSLCAKTHSSVALGSVTSRERMREGSTLRAVYVMTERALACAGNLGWWMLFNGEAPIFCATVMLFCIGKSLGIAKSSEFQSSEGTTMDSVASTSVVSSSESNAMERWRATATVRSVCAGL